MKDSMITQFDNYYVRILTISTDIFTIYDIVLHLYIFFLTDVVKGGNSSGTLLVPRAAAGEEREKEARTPRAPAGGLRPPAPPAE